MRSRHLACGVLGLTNALLPNPSGRTLRFQDVLIQKRRTIATKYLTTWFVPDLLGTIPLAQLVQLFIKTVSSNLQGVKLIR